MDGIVKSKSQYILFFLIIISPLFHAIANEPEHLADLDYNFVFSPTENIEALAQDTRFANRVINQGFNHFVLENTGAAYVPVATLWRIYMTYLIGITTHEMGHYVRVNSFGGEQTLPLDQFFTPGFVAGSSSIPSPTYEKRYLASLGGFEGNSLYALQQEEVFHRASDIYVPDIAPYLMNKLFFPMYGYLIKPGQGGNIETFTKDQAGDIANLSLLAYQRQGGTEVVLGIDGYPILTSVTVPDGVESIYDDMKQKSLYAFLDPMVLWSFYRFTSREQYLAPPKWQITDNFSWMYGIHFSPSLAGYDLYLTQYMTLNDFDFSFYVRDGGPLKSTGYGLNISNIYESESLRLGVNYDMWNQETYGKGSAYALTSRYFFAGDWGLSVKVGKKEAGYIIGQSTEPNTYGYIGFSLN